MRQRRTLLALGLLVVLTGCTTSLGEPESPLDPRTVLVIDHGRHSSVAIETAKGSLVRYSYGDKRYYQDQDTSLASGAAALLWPTPAVLGRAALAGEATPESLEAQLVVGIEEILVVQVEGSKADGLMLELDALHLEGQAEHLLVPAYGLVFAPHPRDYVWWHNSSTMIATWLEEMGVEVRGPGLLASWEVGGSGVSGSP
jgi:hypothetical protein